MLFRTTRHAATRRMMFWHLGPQRLVAAVLERTVDEPLLLSCAATGGATEPPLGPFAAGLLELARALGGDHLIHAAALDSSYCRIILAADGRQPGRAPEQEEAAAAQEAPTSDSQKWLSLPVQGLAGAFAQVQPAAASTAVALFRGARLRLTRLDCACCAVLSLSAFLGKPATQPGMTAAPDPLAAVSVTPECELAATKLGALLAVPVGLALDRFELVPSALG